MMKDLIRDLRPADMLNLSFLSFLVILTVIFFGKVQNPMFLLAIYSSLISIQFVLIRFKRHDGSLGWVYDLIFPTFSILVIFDSLGRLVHFINPIDIDSTLIRWDYLLFSGNPTVMLEKLTSPFLTDILQLAYTSYYFLPVTLGIVLKMKHKDAEFDRSIFLIMLCFYLSYVGYLLMPAIGPRFTLHRLQTSELRGFVLANPIQDLLNTIEGVKRDAFPSGHTGIALTVLYLSWLFERKLFRLFLPFVIALVFSTVYLRYHYVVDVIAGILLALITIITGEIYYGYRRERICTDR